MNITEHINSGGLCLRFDGPDAEGVQVPIPEGNAEAVATDLQINHVFAGTNYFRVVINIGPMNLDIRAKWPVTLRFSAAGVWFYGDFQPAKGGVE